MLSYFTTLAIIFYCADAQSVSCTTFSTTTCNINCDGSPYCVGNTINCGANRNCAIQCKYIDDRRRLIDSAQHLPQKSPTNPHRNLLTYSCSGSSYGCCDSIINCPSGEYCQIDCSDGCSGVTVNAATASELYIKDCNRDNNNIMNCNDMTIYCPRDGRLGSTDKCRIQGDSSSYSLQNSFIYTEEGYRDISIEGSIYLSNTQIFCGKTASEYSCIGGKTACNAGQDTTCNNYIIPQPTQDPTTDPTNNPSKHPTLEPTNYPSKHPTINPTNDPTNNPTKIPTTDPTNDPTNDPSTDPTGNPTQHLTRIPSAAPTHDPIRTPSIAPTNNPTDVTSEPTKKPILNVNNNTPNPTHPATTSRGNTSVDAEQINMTTTEHIDVAQESNFAIIIVVICLGVFILLIAMFIYIKWRKTHSKNTTDTTNATENKMENQVLHHQIKSQSDIYMASLENAESDDDNEDMYKTNIVVTPQSDEIEGNVVVTPYSAESDNNDNDNLENETDETHNETNAVNKDRKTEQENVLLSNSTKGKIDESNSDNIEPLQGKQTLYI